MATSLSGAGAVLEHVFVLAEDFHGAFFPTNVVFRLLVCSLWVCGIRIGHATVLRRWTGVSSLRQLRNGQVRRNLLLLELSTPRALLLTRISPFATLYVASSAALMLLGLVIHCIH